MILVTKLEQLRSLFNKPIHIISGYRCAKHNKACGGVTKSQHLTCSAADIRIEGVDPSRLAKRAHAVFRAIGIYDSFVHVDTRTIRAFWDHRTPKETKEDVIINEESKSSSEGQLPRPKQKEESTKPVPRRTERKTKSSTTPSK